MRLHAFLSHPHGIEALELASLNMDDVKKGADTWAVVRAGVGNARDRTAMTDGFGAVVSWYHNQTKCHQLMPLII